MLANTSHKCWPFLCHSHWQWNGLPLKTQSDVRSVALVLSELSAMYYKFFDNFLSAALLCAIFSCFGIIAKLSFSFSFLVCVLYLSLPLGLCAPPRPSPMLCVRLSRSLSSGSELRVCVNYQSVHTEQTFSQIQALLKSDIIVI